MRCYALVPIFLLVLSGEGFAQTRMEVKVDLSKPKAGGQLLVALCPDEVSYEDNKGCLLRKADASSTPVVLTWDDLAPGTYAVKVIHDIDLNGRIDKNWLGIPTEPYGFSNNVHGNFGPPSFKEAAFTLDTAPKEVHLRLIGG